MVYTTGDALALLSHASILHPGDLLSTGTPSGGGYDRTSPWPLHPGDAVEAGSDPAVVGAPTGRFQPC